MSALSHLHTYERLERRIAEGRARSENVDAFVDALSKLPRPQVLVEYDRWLEQQRRRDDVRAYREMLNYAFGPQGTFADKLACLDLAFEDLDDLLAGR